MTLCQPRNAIYHTLDCLKPAQLQFLEHWCLAIAKTPQSAMPKTTSLDHPWDCLQSHSESNHESLNMLGWNSRRFSLNRETKSWIVKNQSGTWKEPSKKLNENLITKQLNSHTIGNREWPTMLTAKFVKILMWLTDHSVHKMVYVTSLALDG